VRTVCAAKGAMNGSLKEGHFQILNRCPHAQRADLERTRGVIMEKYLHILKKCPLFAGIVDSELRALYGCLSAVEKKYEKNNFIFMADDIVTLIGVVLTGSVHVIREDFWGSRTIIARIEPGGLFGEAFSCAETEKLPLSVLAAEASDILLIDYRKIITTCSSSCTFHTGLIKNMMQILAEKNIMLTQKMEIITQRTTRDKLLAYFSVQARQAGSNAFEIPFNRQELAEYLSVDRSALSNELSKMRDNGILTFHRSRFELL